MEFKWFLIPFWIPLFWVYKRDQAMIKNTKHFFYKVQARLDPAVLWRNEFRLPGGGRRC